MPGATYNLRRGRDLQLNASGSSDPNPDAGDQIAAYDWDLHDRQYDDAAGVDPLVAWSRVQALGVDSFGDHTIALRDTDSFGLTHAASTTLSIVQKPSPIAGADSYTTNEDRPLTITLSGVLGQRQ